MVLIAIRTKATARPGAASARGGHRTAQVYFPGMNAALTRRNDKILLYRTAMVVAFPGRHPGRSRGGEQCTPWAILHFQRGIRLLDRCQRVKARIACRHADRREDLHPAGHGAALDQE